MCDLCRTRDAVLVLDAGERWARPCCFECAEDLVERENAVQIDRGAVETILAATAETRWRPLPPPTIDLATADHSKLHALRASWLEYRDRVGESDRCTGILPSGRRCVRRAESAGLCSTCSWRLSRA